MSDEPILVFGQPLPSGIETYTEGDSIVVIRRVGDDLDNQPPDSIWSLMRNIRNQAFLDYFKRPEGER
jgi:hypothetical protein